MDRDTVRPLVIALLCVVAIGVAAATLDSAVLTESNPGGGFGGDDGSVGVDDDGDGFNIGFNASGGVGGPRFQLCYPILKTLPVVLALVGALLLACALLYRKIGWLGPIAFVGPVGIPGLLLYALLTSCERNRSSSQSDSLLPMPNETTLPEGGSGGFGSGSGVVEPSTSLFVTLLLGFVLLAAVALLFRSAGGEERSASPNETPLPDQSIEAVGRVAGEAADRIAAEADVDNEVYRAWREMTDQLDVSNPESSTPAEFASAAVDAGMTRGDVDELTTLFEEVRYGGEAATKAREERAVAALRRIESKYVTGDDA